MYLKRVELYGFKSFGRRVVAELDPGLNAVVGPNGCGKSNLLDAIRWALGEPSVKTLRGARTDDIIFAGTRHLPPVGFAEVTLTFDNEDQAFPLPCSEVAITRRAYRSGQSLFAINGVPCRLRDVQELLSRAGFGARSHVLVGQGAFDGLVLGPGEARRAALEEVAGLGRYRQLASLAEFMRQRAQAALERAKAALGERGRHVAFLERQAARARQARERSSRLAAVERELARRARQLAESHAREAQEEMEASRRQLAAVQEELRRVREEADRLFQQHGLDLQQAAETARRLQGLREQLLERRHELLRARDREYEAAGDLDGHRQARAEALGRLEAMAAERNRWAGRSREALAELARIESRLDFLRLRLEQAAGQVSGREQELEARRRDLLEALQSLSVARNEQQAARRELDGLERQLHALQTREAELRQSRQELATRIQGHLKRLQEAGASEERAALEWQVLRQELDGARQEDAAFDERHARARALVVQLSEQLQALQRARLELEGYSRVVRALAEARGPWRSALLGPLGELVRVPAGLDDACAAGLGGFFEAVVVHSAEAAHAAIEWLRERRQGWATFLALDYLRPHPLPGPLRQRLERAPGCLGILSDLLEVSDEARPALQYAAGRVAVVEDLARAIDVGRRFPQLSRVVTLRGEVVVPGGPVSGGFREGFRAELVARSRRLDEIAARLAQAQAEVDRLAEERRLHHQAIARLEAALSAADQRRQATAAGIAQLRAELAGLEARLEALDRQTDAIRSERARLEQEREQAAQQEAALKARLAREAELEQHWRQALAALTVELETARSERGQLEQELLEAKGALEALRAQAQVAAARQEQAEAELARVQDEVARHEQAAQAAAADVERSRRLAARLQEEIEQLQAEVRRLEGEQQGRSRQAEEMARHLEAARARARALEGEVERASAAFLRADRTWQHAQARLAEAERRLQEASVSAPPPEASDGLEAMSQPALEQEAERLRSSLAALGPVDLAVLAAYEEARSEFERACQDRDDVHAALEDLGELQRQLDQIAARRLVESVQEVSRAFQEIFTRLFAGGEARLFIEGDRPLEGRVVLEVRPPAKRLQPAVALSGGERALVAAALVFALQAVRPSPVSVLDELDSALDEANLERLLSVVVEMSRTRQMVLITHRQRTMEAASALFGVTMDETGLSRLVVLRLTPGGRPLVRTGGVGPGPEEDGSDDEGLPAQGSPVPGLARRGASA